MGRLLFVEVLIVFDLDRLPEPFEFLLLLIIELGEVLEVGTASLQLLLEQTRRGFLHSRGRVFYLDIRILVVYVLGYVDLLDEAVHVGGSVVAVLAVVGVDVVGLV